MRTEHLLHPRVTENIDWAIALFVLAFIIIVFNKSTYESRFIEFMKLIFSDKYTKIYRDSTNLRSGFTVSLFIVQIISISFFIQLALVILGYASRSNWILYIQIATALSFFILSKFLVEKIIAVVFDIEEFADQINLQKVNYRTYLGIMLLPLNIILFNYNLISADLLKIIIAFLLLFNAITYFITMKNHQKIILSKLFYFILYICTLEIAPYFFIYIFIVK